jgi:hypothetical protein
MTFSGPAATCRDHDAPAANTSGGNGCRSRGRANAVVLLQQNAPQTSRLRSGQVNAMTLTIRADPQGGSSVKHCFTDRKNCPYRPLAKHIDPTKNAKLAKLSGFCSSMYDRISIVFIPQEPQVHPQRPPTGGDVVNKPLKTR